ncbi:MAG: nucleotidyl transferase AbiEii/AbiGii toxin family protein [archaeon]
MVENLFQIREKEIFEILNSLKGQKFVIIGGYAVNAYVLPRFSVDCDIVIHKEDISKITAILEKIGFTESRETSELSYGGKFKRFEKQIKKDFGVSIDILIGEVMDRQTGSVFSADWIFENSQIRILRGKTITEKLETRIVNPEALFATKLVSCRKTDIRDMFLLISEIKNKDWVKQEVSSRCSFSERFKILSEEIGSNQFKDGLQGVFGYIDPKLFEKHKKLILSLEK